MKHHLRFLNVSYLIAGAGILFLAGSVQPSAAYSRYRDPVTGTGNCSSCHGSFTGSTSPKGTVFPSGSKHEMHRASTSMATACNLCHSTSDNRNPYMASSTGTSANPGLGCSGCHVGAGLRAHHAANGVMVCNGCHMMEMSVPENVRPPYYGTVDTKANHPENLVRAANTNENWSVGDFSGLDNDGNNLYDAADFACSPYQILSVTPEGANMRISWQTAGGRMDAVQASPLLSGPYTNICPPLTMMGMGVMMTNYLEIGGATNHTRFYRISYQP